MDVEQVAQRRRINWTVKNAAGVGIAGAVLLLWPFAGWSWWPLLIGLGVLILIRLLRLDGLMRGWDPHVAGLVVVGLLVVRTSPWIWALAASLGILLAGLVRLPRWQLLAVGGVLTAASITGFAISEHQGALNELQQYQQTNDDSRSQIGSRKVTTVLPDLAKSIARGDTVAVCGLLVGNADEQFTKSLGAADCPAAVRKLTTEVTDPARYSTPLAPAISQNGNTWLIDACHVQWPQGSSAGPQLGQLEVHRSNPPGETYVVAGFTACAA